MKRLLCVAVAALPTFAQLLPPNVAGVTAGHDIFSAKDNDAARKFWDALGAQPASLGRLNLIKFPGVLFLSGQRDHKGGSEGSSVDDIGFKVKNLKASLAKWEVAGIKPLSCATATECILVNPDGVKVHIVEDKSIPTEIAADGPKMVVPDVAEAQAWYAKYFGAKLVKRGNETVAEIPGSTIRFAQGTVVGTQGRALDRLGFEVTDLKAFAEKLQAAGIKTSNINDAHAKGLDLAVFTMTDPWGTFIEVSQGLAAVK